MIKGRRTSEKNKSIAKYALQKPHALQLPIASRPGLVQAGLKQRLMNGQEDLMANKHSAITSKALSNTQ